MMKLFRVGLQSWNAWLGKMCEMDRYSVQCVVLSTRSLRFYDFVINSLISFWKAIIKNTLQIMWIKSFFNANTSQRGRGAKSEERKPTRRRTSEANTEIECFSLSSLLSTPLQLTLLRVRHTNQEESSFTSPSHQLSDSPKTIILKPN